jgi:hypothetical protein
MDASVLVSLSDSEEKLQLPKAKDALKGAKIQFSCFVADFCRISPAQHKVGPVIKKIQLRINSSYRKPLRQVSPPRRGAQNPFYYAFEGQKVSLTSLIEPTLSPNSLNSPNFRLFSMDSRTKSRDFRRLKWVPSRSQPTSQDYSVFDQLSPPKTMNKRRKFRTELIPQTKAAVFGKSPLKVELRIHGTIKDINWRDSVKEISDATEMDDFNSINQ